MNPLFTLGEEFRFHDSSRFREKAGDAKLPFYHSFVPVLMSLAAESCRCRAESVHLLEPHLQWERVERVPTLWLQTTPQETARCARFFFVFFGRRPLPFGGSHLRLPSGPAGIRTTTGSLSALARPTPYQLSHRVAYRKMRKMMSLNCSICLMPIFGVGKVYRIWTPRGGPPQLRWKLAA